MLKISKRVEYALFAVQMMAHQPGLVSAKEIAARFDISVTLVAKVLQLLVRAGYVRSSQGVQGGYALAVPPTQISIADIITAIEGGNPAIVSCQSSQEHECSVHSCCTIKEPLAVLQERIDETFRSMSVAELARPTLVSLQL
jgi:Rrf2 family protein